MRRGRGGGKGEIGPRQDQSPFGLQRSAGGEWIFAIRPRVRTGTRRRTCARTVKQSQIRRRVDSHDLAISDLVKSIRALVSVPDAGRSRPIGCTADIEDE